MTDHQKVYTKVVKTLKQLLKLSHPGHGVTLAMMATGNVMGHNAQLSAINSEIPVDAKNKSLERRLRRWVKHESIDVETIYLLFAQQILEALSSFPLILVMGGSQIGRGGMALEVTKNPVPVPIRR